jgi:hypothetical protein
VSVTALFFAAQAHYRLRDWRGDCYECAASFVLERPVPGLLLAQGEPLGTGGDVEGLRYGHAWVELGPHVFDFTFSPNPLPLPAYYNAGRIDRGLVRLYTADEALAFTNTHGHWGPWEN